MRHPQRFPALSSAAGATLLVAACSLGGAGCQASPGEPPPCSGACDASPGPYFCTELVEAGCSGGPTNVDTCNAYIGVIWSCAQLQECFVCMDTGGPYGGYSGGGRVACSPSLANTPHVVNCPACDLNLREPADGGWASLASDAGVGD